MKAQPVSRISPADLNNLMALLEVEVVALSECLVNSGFRLETRNMAAPGIHYIMKGKGRISIKKGMSYDVAPHSWPRRQSPRSGALRTPSAASHRYDPSARIAR